MFKPLLLTAALLAVPAAARADNIANCEVVLMEKISDEGGNGGMEIASYRPAEDFLQSVFADSAAQTEIDGLPIRAVLCTRTNWLPSEMDFKILRTGLPFVLSPNFDSTDAWTITYYFKDGAFHHIYKGYNMPEDARAEIVDLLAEFSAREHGLPKQPTEENADDIEADE